MYNIKKTSDKKICIKYIIPIICNNELVDEIKFRLSCRLDLDDYKIIHPRKRFFEILSQSYGVKMKYINYSLNEVNLLFENKCITNIISKINISDNEWFKKWKRDNKIKEILK